MHFQLRIELGNDAMQTADDLGRALIDLGERLHAIGAQPDNWHATAGPVRDDNGNRVGEWELIA